MKKNIIRIVLLMLLSFNNIAVAADITLVVPHGHSGNKDGGILVNSETTVYTAQFTIPSSPTSGNISWTGNAYDPLGTHSTTVNPERINFPSGYNYVKINCTFNIQGSFVGTPTSSQLVGFVGAGGFTGHGLCASDTYPHDNYVNTVNLSCPYMKMSEFVNPWIYVSWDNQQGSGSVVVFHDSSCNINFSR
jgi:hypothetical protein